MKKERYPMSNESDTHVENQGYLDQENSGIGVSVVYVWDMLDIISINHSYA